MRGSVFDLHFLSGRNCVERGTKEYTLQRFRLKREFGLSLSKHETLGKPTCFACPSYQAGELPEFCYLGLEFLTYCVLPRYFTRERNSQRHFVLRNS